MDPRYVVKEIWRLSMVFHVLITNCAWLNPQIQKFFIVIQVINRQISICDLE